MAASGFAPYIGECGICGEAEPRMAYLDFQEGTIKCGDCSSGGGALLSAAALKAARYVTGCDLKKLLSFTIGEPALKELGGASEGYLLAHLDRRFRTLDFYNTILL